MEDSNTELISEDKKNREEQFLDSPNNNQPHVIVHDKTESVTYVDSRNECPYK